MGTSSVPGGSAIPAHPPNTLVLPQCELVHSKIGDEHSDVCHVW